MPSDATAAQRLTRLLLFSRHFPPSEEAGALRWQKLAALAPLHGFSLSVYTTSTSELRRADARRLEELPASLSIAEVASPSTGAERIDRTISPLARGIRAVLSGLRSGGESGEAASAPQPIATSVSRDEALLAPRSLQEMRRSYHAYALRAKELAWARAAVREAQRRDSGEHAAVISCGPPHQVHVAAAGLARRWRLPHVVDMRDPWSLVERVPEAFAARSAWDRAADDEAAVFASAALIVSNTARHAEALRERYPKKADQIIAVLNGFDEEALPVAPVQPAFTIVHAGTIYLDRDPAMLLLPVAELVQRLGLTPQDLQLVFVGEVDVGGSEGLQQLAMSLGLADHVRVLGRVPRAEALRMLSTADMTVVLPQDSHLAVPSKVYEYLRFPAWMLVLAEAESATADTLRGTGADVVRPQDRDAISDAMARRFRQWKAEGRPKPLADTAHHLSRRAQADILFGRIRQLTVR